MQLEHIPDGRLILFFYNQRILELWALKSSLHIGLYVFESVHQAKWHLPMREVIIDWHTKCELSSPSSHNPVLFLAISSHCIIMSKLVTVRSCNIPDVIWMLGVGVRIECACPPHIHWKDWKTPYGIQLYVNMTSHNQEPRHPSRLSLPHLFQV